MAFTPIRLISPQGRAVLVGSAVEREHLISHGYKIEESTPAPAVEEPTPAPVADEKPAVEDKPAVNTRKATTK